MPQEFKTADLSNHLSTQNNNNDNASISGVSFNEQKRSFQPKEKEIGWVMKLALKTGWVKNEKEANLALLILVVLIFILAIIVWPSSKTTNTPTSEQERQIQLVEEAMKKGVPVLK